MAFYHMVRDSKSVLLGAVSKQLRQLIIMTFFHGTALIADQQL
ncbi:hypothetical protein JCM19237_3757 [Photobacterium aphoticum]|uniref:Uncharacterized protein n=1 Tax=Photobacterium aphoticum TaxID=754436 RepID=A0A090QYY1_9GAMM|nr:hypothetical protein JCM19237_3757 [Photobacterium aphoticum]